MKTRHKFLEKFYSHTSFPHQYELSKDRKKRFKKIKRKYGIDIRECWNMDVSFYAWLYEHLCMYEKYTIADIDDARAVFTYNGKTYTQRQLMHKLKKRLTTYFKSAEETDISEKKQKKIDEIIPIWQVLMPAMWW